MKKYHILGRLKDRLNDQFLFTEENGDHLDYNNVTERHFMGAQRDSGLSRLFVFMISGIYLESFYDEWNPVNSFVSIPDPRMFAGMQDDTRFQLGHPHPNDRYLQCSHEVERSKVKITS